MPKFSIIIAVYNKERYISRTLQSVIDQTYGDFEIIIINDGSTDNSENQIFKFKDPRIHYFKQSNQGAGAARNNAILKLTGSYIALLDADDIWDKNYLKEQETLISEYPEESIFASAITKLKENKKISKTYSVSNKTPGLYSYFENSMQTSLLHSSSTILKKSVFENIGYYDPNIKSGQDTDLYIRIGLKYSIVFNPKPLVTYTINDDSLWRSIETVKDRTHFEKYKSTEQTNPALKKFLDINRFSLAIQAKIWGEFDYFNKFIQQIDSEHLNKKQHLLLKQPAVILKILFSVKQFLENIGISFTIFGR